jgi:hypothetical protein
VQLSRNAAVVAQGAGLFAETTLVANDFNDAESPVLPDIGLPVALDHHGDGNGRTLWHGSASLAATAGSMDASGSAHRTTRVFPLVLSEKRKNTGRGQKFCRLALEKPALDITN